MRWTRPPPDTDQARRPARGGLFLARGAGALLRRPERRRRRRAAGCSRSSPSSTCRARRSRTSSTASRWISTPSRYQTFDDLLEYCRRVASAVGLICIEIFGCRSAQARDYALNLGVALQLTNIIRDVKDDLDAGRRLPAARGSAGRAAARSRIWRRGVMTEPVRRLLAFECQRAREFYQRAHRRAAARGSPPAGRGRDHAGGLLRDAAAHRAQRLRRVLRRASGCRDPRQALIALEAMAVADA